MFSIHRLTNALVTMSINPGEISIGLIKPSGNRLAPLELHAIRTIANNKMVVDGAITNPSLLQKHINSFADHYQVNNACLAISLGGNGIYERLVTLQQTPKNHAAFSYLKLGRLSWDYSYLYPNEQGNFVYYIAGISRELLFQYQLCMLQTSLKLVTVTTATQSLLSLYHHMYGSAFRQSQLANDMTSSQNRLELLINRSMMQRIISIKTSYTEQQFHHLLINTGLYLNQKG